VASRRRTGKPQPMHLDHALAVADAQTLTGGPERDALTTLAATVRAGRDGYGGTPTPWAEVEAGAVFVGANGLWFVEEAPKDRPDRQAVIRCGAERHEVGVYPTDTIDVLVPLVERNAARLLVAELGARRAS
jgi:hypothetical protein